MCGPFAMLVTERLLLRGPQQTDLDDLFAIYSDPQVMRYWSTPPHPDLTTTQEMLLRMIAHAHAPLRYFVIDMHGKAIGCAGMHQADEIGFILGRDHWRQGIITEAMAAIIPHLFATTDVSRLTADVDPRNIASVNALKSMGFSETGTEKNTFYINGEWSDSVYLALPRP